MEGFSSTCREKVQIWGCERAYARSHPQIWVSITENPREPMEAKAFGQLELLACHACRCNSCNDFALEDRVEDQNRRRGNKCGSKGQPALNITSLLDDDES